MAAQPVEWVLVVYYGPAAHQATYGRQVKGGGYTKDFIQLSRKDGFLEETARLFSVDPSATSSVPLTYQWPTGNTRGAFVFKSADRPHLKWETSLGAPQVWKMAHRPSSATPETIPGNPSHTEFADAEEELALVAARGGGQPYLLAIKLRDEPRTLHLRVYLGKPSEAFAWADLRLAPEEVQALAASTSQRSALAWSLFHSGGIAPSVEVDAALAEVLASNGANEVLDSIARDTGRSLVSYLRSPGYGLFFDPTRNHDAWAKPAPLPSAASASVEALLRTLEGWFPELPQGDAAAEAIETDPEEVGLFTEQISAKNFAVADALATVKTRGNAQKAFALAVKGNYGSTCAVTGVTTKSFLVASHIVPWSADQAIRLDPSNGICLSLIVDRAFEKGYLQIEDDLTIRINLQKVGTDNALRMQLEPYHGAKLKLPSQDAPQVTYLQRRRALIAGVD